MFADNDLEALVDLEQTFFEAGRRDGEERGRIQGFEEGRQLGKQAAFEILEEIGYYEGFARATKYLPKSQNRVSQTAGALLELISQFPLENASSSSVSSVPTSSEGDTSSIITPAQLNNAVTASEVDIEKLLNQIRSRYKMLCVSLGVQPSLRAHKGSSSSKNGSEVKGGRSASSRLSRNPPVWKLENSEAIDLSF